MYVGTFDEEARRWVLQHTGSCHQMLVNTSNLRHSRGAEVSKEKNISLKNSSMLLID